MLKNINIEDDIQNNSKNSENIEDSITLDENDQEPLCSFDISLNNGKKASLLIYEGDDYKKKVINFCEKYKISPDDAQVLMQRVQEELNINSNPDTMKYDKNDIEENISNEGPQNKFIPETDRMGVQGQGFIAKEKNKLDHILNESESISVYESIKQSKDNDKMNNLIKEYNDLINNNNININNNINSSVNPTLNINNMNSNNGIIPNNNINSKINIDNNTMYNSNNSINKNTFPVIQNNAYNINQTTPINMPNYNKNNITTSQAPCFYNVKDNKNKNKPKTTLPLNNKVKPIYYNNNINKNNLNNTLQYNNNNLLLINSPKVNNKNNYSDYSFNPKRTKTSVQKIESFDNNITYITNPNINNTNNIITPKNNIINYNQVINQNNSPKVIQKKTENVIYQYPVNTQTGVNINPNTINKNKTIVYTTYNEPITTNLNKPTNKYAVVHNLNKPKEEKVIQAYNIENNINNINNPKSISINYDNLNNNYNYNNISSPKVDKKIYKTIVKPPIEYTEYTNNNINSINSPNYNTTNFESINNQIIENNNYDTIEYSPNLKYDKYDTNNNQLVEYKYDSINTNNLDNNNSNSQNLYSTQNDFQIYENIPSSKADTNNNINDITDITNQNFEYINPINNNPEYPKYSIVNKINEQNINNDENENELINNNNIQNNKKRNTKFISNVKKISGDDVTSNEIKNETDNYSNNHTNEIQINSEINNNEIISNPDYNSTNNNINIISSDAINSITKVNDINISSTPKVITKQKLDKINDNNFSIIQSQNLDYKSPEKKEIKNNENIIPNNINNKETNLDNKSNDIYIKKNIDIFNDSKNKINPSKNNIVSNIGTSNIKKSYTTMNKSKDKNLIKKPDNIIHKKPKIENRYQIGNSEVEPELNNIIREKNTNYIINTSPTIRKKEINNNIIEENKKEIKSPLEKKIIIDQEDERSNKENLNDNSSENRIIIDEENEDKEPQDNCKRKKIMNDLPKDTDESHYKESQIQYDNLSSDSKNNRSAQKTNKKNIYNLNDDNISEHNLMSEEEFNNSIDNNKNNNNKEIIKKNLVNNINYKIYNSNTNPISNNNNIKNDSSYNMSENMNTGSINNDKFMNYIDKDLNLNKPKYKKNNPNLESQNSFPSQSIQNSNKKNITKKNNLNIYQKKEIINKKSPLPQKRKMKVLTIKNNNLQKNKSNINNNTKNKNKNKIIIDKRSKSSEAKSYNKYNTSINRAKNPGERLYENYMKRLPKKMEEQQKILKERLEEENKELILKPKINENSRRMVEKMRMNGDEENKVEIRLINYGNNKKQKHLIDHYNKDLQNQITNSFRPKINKTSRKIAERNKQNRIYETNTIIRENKRKSNHQTIDLEKEFGKRNRSIGNEHKNINSFINFDDSNKINKEKNTNKKYSNINSESNYSNNINSIRNTKHELDTLEENNQSSNPFNKTSELNNAYRELYNSIDEKTDSDLTKFFTNDLNSNLTENNAIKKTNLNESKISKNSKNKTIFHDTLRSLTPPSYIKNYQNYNAFDYLYYESENLGKKNKKKQELNFKRNHPFKPRISQYAKNINNNESTNEFFNRISKNLEEIKIVNSKPKKNKPNLLEKNDINNNYNFRPRISRGPKNENQRDINVDLNGFYDKRITKEKNKLQKLKEEEEQEKKNIYNQKSKDIIIKMKFKKYKELFSKLDSDQDGLISSSKIQLTKVEKNVLQNITPILEELNQTKKEMDFKEFCLKIDKLMTEKNDNIREDNK